MATAKRTQQRPSDDAPDGKNGIMDTTSLATQLAEAEMEIQSPTPEGPAPEWLMSLDTADREAMIEALKGEIIGNKKLMSIAKKNGFPCELSAFRRLRDSARNGRFS